jgi:hypothetical protein
MVKDSGAVIFIYPKAATSGCTTQVWSPYVSIMVKAIITSFRATHILFSSLTWLFKPVSKPYVTIRAKFSLEYLLWVVWERSQLMLKYTESKQQKKCWVQRVHYHHSMCHPTSSWLLSKTESTFSKETWYCCVLLGGAGLWFQWQLGHFHQSWIQCLWYECRLSRRTGERVCDTLMGIWVTMCQVWIWNVESGCHRLDSIWDQG